MALAQKLNINTNWLLLGVLLITVVFSLCVGAYFLSWSELWMAIWSDSDEYATQSFLITNIRLPRTFLAILVGSGLAISGIAVQTIFRNPLADPGLIGISSGAMLFAVFFIVLKSYLPFSIGEWTNQIGLAFSAFVGGLLTTYVVYQLATKDAITHISTMLLAGIAIAALCGGLTGLLVYYADEAQLRDITFWNLGSVSGANWNVVLFLTIVNLIGGWQILYRSKQLEIMQLGEQEAHYLGVDVQRTKQIIIIFVVLIVGSSVAFTGLIGFIGLVVPHLVRIYFPQSKFSDLVLATTLVGAVLLLLADTLARTIIAPSELPIGILTALMGAPFFLWLLIKNRNQY